MAEMLASSLLWRVLLAIGGWFSALAHSSRIFAWLGRTWRASKTRAWLLRRLSASDAPTRESWSAKRFARLNARLAARHGLKDCLDDSVLCRIWRFFVRCGQNSRLFSWLFSDGLHGVILFALSMYVVIDYVLRDLLAVPVLSSCWDECLMLLALGYVVYERLGRETPLKTGCNPLDLPVCLFITVCFVLMNVVTPYYSIQISGFRATVQYMLWFFLITRLVHNDRDFMRIYLALVILAAVIALHGIYQYIAAVPIPSSWMTHSESSVRTRVYSIFGSPNIMGDFMTMFAPMAAGLAYYTKNRRLQVLAWLCAFCMCFGCLFTMSRAAWVAMAVAIILFILLVDRRLFLLLAAGLALLVLIPFVRTRIGFLFTQDFIDANTNGGRGGRWPLGLELLQAYGVHQVDLAGIFDEKLQRNKEQFGVTETYNTTREQIPADSYDVIVEAVGLPTTQAQAVAAAKKGAQVLMFGVGPQEAHFEMNTYDIYKKQLTIQGSFINPLTFRDAISLVSSGKMNIGGLISHELELEQVQDFLDGKITGVSKAVVKVGK